MREMLRTLIESVSGGHEAVLCSLVETRGSTPQKAGACMLVFADGTQAGTLGGGCVEAAVKQKALGLFNGGAPELVTFQLDDNFGWDDGLICGGRMTVFAEPVRMHGGLDYFRAFHELVERGEGCTEAIVMESTRLPGAVPGARVLFAPNGDVVARRRIDGVPAEIVRQLPVLRKRPRASSYMGVAYLPVLARCRLVIVGAGHVGQAVAALAAQADFDVWILDDRDRYANRQRFPAAERIIVGDIGRELPELEIDPRTYSIIVTRGHSHDEEALLHLVRRPARYVGMIGSQRKIRLIFDDLLAAGVAPEQLARVHAPLGLDIGSQTVPEIAVSIVAELIAHRNLGALPQSLRERPNTIFAPDSAMTAATPSLPPTHTTRDA